MAKTPITPAPKASAPPATDAAAAAAAANAAANTGMQQAAEAWAAGLIAPAEPAAAPPEPPPAADPAPLWAEFDTDFDQWTDDQKAAFQAWFDELPEGEDHVRFDHPGAVEAFLRARDAHFAGVDVRAFSFELEELGPILGETVFFRSAQSDLSGTAKAGQEVPAMITQVHSAKSVDLTVFRPNGMTPIGVVNVQNHPAGKESPFHTSWRRPTRDDLPRS